jgi:hypothetical protein
MCNANADTLSRSPQLQRVCLLEISTGRSESGHLPTSIKIKDLAAIIEYLRWVYSQLTSALLEASMLEDGVLYKVELCVISPADWLFNDTHSGVFGAHLQKSTVSCNATTGGVACDKTSRVRHDDA